MFVVNHSLNYSSALFRYRAKFVITAQLKLYVSLTKQLRLLFSTHFHFVKEITIESKALTRDKQLMFGSLQVFTKRNVLDLLKISDAQGGGYSPNTPWDFRRADTP